MWSTSSISCKTNFFKVYTDLFLRLHSGLFACSLITCSPTVLQWHLEMIEILWSVVVGSLVNNAEARSMGCQVITSWVYSVWVHSCVTQSRSFSVPLSVVWRLFSVLLINVADGGKEGSWTVPPALCLLCTEAFCSLSSACSAQQSARAVTDVALLPKIVKECSCNFNGKPCLFARMGYFI